MTATISDQSYSLRSPTGSMLNLRLEQSRRHIEANRESTVFVEVEISPDQSTQIAQKNHHICLVIDCSGSMEDDMKIEQAKNAAIKLVRGLPSTDTVSIVAFDDDVHVILDPKPASERQYIENMIHSITTGYATAMHAGISKGFDLVQQSHTLSSSNTINRLVVITDGLANVEPCEDEDFIQLAKEIRKSGITTSTMGIGDDYNEQILKSVSEFGGGSWDHIVNASDLSKVVNDQATQMQQTIVTNPQLRITLMDTAELLEANASKPKVMPIDDLKTTGNVTIIGLKDIIRNEPHALHFKIKVNAGEGENIPFLTAEILEGSNVVAGPDTIEISYTNDRKLYNIENKNIFWSFLGTEATILNGKTLDGDSDAGKRADTIMNTLESSKKLEEGTLAHDTVAHAEKIHGKIVPNLTASEKKKLLHSTTVMEDTMTEKLDEAINDLKNSEEDEKE